MIAVAAGHLPSQDLRLALELAEIAVNLAEQHNAPARTVAQLRRHLLDLRSTR